MSTLTENNSTTGSRLLQSTTAATGNISINSHVNSITCWNGIYYVHATFSIIGCLMLIIISIIVKLTYFETKTSANHNHYTAKGNSKSDVFILISKIIIVLLFGFIGNNDNSWVLIVIMLFLAAFMFASYYENRPYYNNRIMKVSRIFIF